MTANTFVYVLYYKLDVNKLEFVGIFSKLSCAVFWGLHVDYINSAVGCSCVMQQAYLFRGICQ